MTNLRALHCGCVLQATEFTQDATCVQMFLKQRCTPLTCTENEHNLFLANHGPVSTIPPPTGSQSSECLPTWPFFCGKKQTLHLRYRVFLWDSGEHGLQPILGGIGPVYGPKIIWRSFPFPSFLAQRLNLRGSDTDWNLWSLGRRQCHLGRGRCHLDPPDESVFRRFHA